MRAIAAAGVRKQGSPEKFTINDLVHIGSNTKAMTSTMLATLVEDGTFINGWETTIAEVFPELVDAIHPDYRAVTLWQLVSHTSGLARNAQNWITPSRYTNHTKSSCEPAGRAYRRVPVFQSWLHGRWRHGGKPDRKELGDLDGGAPVHTPLGMYSAGFGAPNTPNEVDQPMGA